MVHHRTHLTSPFSHSRTMQSSIISLLPLIVVFRPQILPLHDFPTGELFGSDLHRPHSSHHRPKRLNQLPHRFSLQVLCIITTRLTWSRCLRERSILMDFTCKGDGRSTTLSLITCSSLIECI